jgi:hypothetical protein
VPDLSLAGNAVTDTVPRPPLGPLIRLTGVALAARPMVRAGLPRLQRWLEPAASGRTRPLVDSTDVDQVAAQLGRWVDAIVRRGQPVIRPGCQTRGVALYYGLRRQGLDVALCFGVGTVAGAVEGHCWIDLEGEPLLEPFDPRTAFTEVVRVSRGGVSR